MNNQELAPLESFRMALEGDQRAEIAKILPKGIDPDRFIKTTLNTVQMHPELLDANRTSLFTACMQAAKDGLLADGKEATIQIYNTNKGTHQNPNWVKMAQYMPMARGLVKKMYEAGGLKVDAAAVYEKDKFRFLRGDDDRIEHEPYLGPEDPGAIIAAYAIVKLGNGEIKREVMTARDIEKVRAMSKAPDGPGWSNWRDQFAIKAVLKRIYKQLPDRDDGIERVFDADNEAMGFTSINAANNDISDVTGNGVVALPFYPDDKLSGGLSTWADLIVSGKKSADDIIATIGTKYQLTDEQQQKIKDLTPANNEETDENV